MTLELPPPLPTLSQIQADHHITAPASLVAERLLSLAQSHLQICSDADLTDAIDWEIDLCSATFFASYALCLDPSSIRARRLLARCSRLGGLNVVLPFSPAGSAGSANVSAAQLNSFDTNDVAGAQACIHTLQQGPSTTFRDTTSAKEYREACRTLGRTADAIEVVDLLQDKVLGKRKAVDSSQTPAVTPPPELVSPSSRYQSQLSTDQAYQAAKRHQIDKAKSHFRRALSKDPFNWRAWAGLCDVGHSDPTEIPVIDLNVLQSMYARLSDDICGPYAEAAASVSVPVVVPVTSEAWLARDEAADTTAMARKISEDGANKKLKVSTDRPPSQSSGTVASQRRSAAKVAPPAPTTAASTVTATRLHPVSRALSAAQTNTVHSNVTKANSDDVKVAVKTASIGSRTGRTGVTRANPTQAANGTSVSSNTAVGRQTRSTAAARGPTSVAGSRLAQPATRSGATSQAGSVSSLSSNSSSASSATSRATASTARTAVSRAAASHPSTRAVKGKLANGTSTTATGRGAAGPSGASATKLAARSATTSTGSVSRPGSAMSKASTTSSAGTARNLGGPHRVHQAAAVAAAAAAEREAAAAAQAARFKLDLIVQMRETAMKKLSALAQRHAADMYVVALLAQVGEAYRLLRLCEGEKAASVLKGPVLASVLIKGQAVGKVQKKQSDDEELPDAESAGTEEEEDSLLDPCIANSIVHQALLGRAYNECSQYASAETHFTQLRALNPFMTAHMDIFSLVLFHLSREVTLSSLAQHLSLVAPASATTQIVVGNAFSLQKEHQTAFVCFQRAAAAAPDYAYAYTLAGHEAHDLGLHDEAIAYFRSAIRCDRRHWNAWAGLGRVYLGIGEHEHAACKCLQQAIGLNPRNHILWDLVGWTFSLIDAPTSALECYDRAIELAPRASVLTYLRRAELLLHHAHADAAHRDLVTAHDLAPEEASIHILLAQSYMRLGGGAFCELENNGASANPHKPGLVLRATGSMVLPSAYQAEIAHHLSVAIDLDPALLKVVKTICEGHKNLPAPKLGLHPIELSLASPSRSHLDPEASMSQLPSHTAASTRHVAMSTAHATLVAPPPDFATSHPGVPDASTSFMSTTTVDHSLNTDHDVDGEDDDIVLHDQSVESLHRPRAA
ncbi:hypothetical protein BCV70DRAFT_172555 [Testicularia cyperi]|uniref:TPR-like protein n=1 Tax=Testicularia cyperi TaxID=1882483 RepID=A0A317XST3_9BASI|nr:hypothetical protein BCV70DRAFT_172555 [Testicularia cyperi]